ncbi:MAG TPA: DUF2059 domain-containing protein [Beijerinckiaceae bacterium]|nr:DUF2059 domain-containing protein [Beijerinckiaceae bacterium]
MLSRIAIFAVALGITPAFAQQPAPSQGQIPSIPFFASPPSGGSPAGAPPAAAPAAAPSVAGGPQQSGSPGATIPASTFAAARDLVVASGMSRSFDAAVNDLSSQLVTTITRTRPDLAPDLKVVMQQLSGEFSGQSETMINNAARIYASAMTEQEIKDCVAFFNSPAGKRYVGFEPVILVNLDDAMKAWTQGVSAGMMDRVREEMKKKGHDDF